MLEIMIGLYFRCTHGKKKAVRRQLPTSKNIEGRL